MFNKKFLVKVFFTWLPFAVMLTLVSGLIYLAVQQSLRSSAVNPQMQIAEDEANKLAESSSSTGYVTTLDTIDISKSLSPYVIVFDDNYNVNFSTALLNNNTPIPPDGVFEYTKANGLDTITWEPQKGVRSVIVVQHFEGKNSGYVLVGRSLRQIELTEDHIMILIFVGWLASLFCMLVAIVFIKFLEPKEK